MDVHMLKGMVLYDRLPVGHPAKVKMFGEVKRSLAGAAGEKRTVELLERELDLVEKAKIFRGVWLPYMDGFAQVDVLVLHPNFVCALEVKNMIGEFHFDSINFQFHRIIDGRVEGMRNPESQLHRAVKASEKFFGCKVHGTIVLSSRSGRVAVPPKLYSVIALDYLPFHIEKMVDVRTAHNVEGLEGLVRRSRGQFNGPDLLEKHKLTRECLEVGVRCLGCGKQKMEWSRLRWRCNKCGKVSADTHEFALQEYMVLFGEELTTEFAYTWLGIKDKYTLYRMLEKSTIKINNRGKRLIIEKRELLIDYFETIYS
ncbi:nuclease-related domain-containing protein [Planomicrobium okeanokoites]|uniref:Nuclease-related domain-containing protein n=1 Tax=Planomicrobium okeanokoites TaxID=244 RepID=A0ABV7KRF0_PLAOK|nr:nuclease-related domain-containing protein [Planomicrobium okeanokoites]TAA70903.1 NERD domain-containing protein [Planomicrobium okeanokoites]